MSLYNALFGVNELAPLLLQLLELSPETVPGLRDCWFDSGQIVVYTRTGGANRRKCAAENEQLVRHPLYLRDEDDEYDGIYAKWYFSFPRQHDDLKSELLACPGASPLQPSERWKGLVRKLEAGDRNDPEVRNAIEVGRAILGRRSALALAMAR